MVDDAGRPTDCIVQEATNPRRFAEVSCEVIMRKARFLPALDAQGAPINSYWSHRIRWVVPR
jgi:hypothetical protein